MLAITIGDHPEPGAIGRPGSGLIVGEIAGIAQLLDLAGLHVQQLGQQFEIGAGVDDQQMRTVR